MENIKNKKSSRVNGIFKINLHIKDKARNKYTYLLKALDEDYATAISQLNINHYL